MPSLTLASRNQPSEENSDSLELDCLKWEAEFSFISYGVRIGIRVNKAKVLECLPDYLPPGWQPSASPDVDQLYSLIGDESNYQLWRDREILAEASLLETILHTLDTDLRLQIGMLVQDRLFVHAGVVGWRGQAIVIPGRSFSGKTTLTAALVQAGATYYSDEYAVFDLRGWVHPYPRRLAIREWEGEQEVKRQCTAEELGGTVGSEPLPVGLVAHVQYQPNVVWCPKKISAGVAVLALLDNAIVARTRPEFALSILPSVVSDAFRIAGKRGEAAAVAVALLHQLDDWIEDSSDITPVALTIKPANLPEEKRKEMRSR
ncbi:MAG: hypothetical protein ACLFWI_10995 [Coleofasciculus sp.]|uniref:hypothetical protein n=1 Tax=Coleofasciculus sp. TaxID=3100458 RepID=UPI003A2F939B